MKNYALLIFLALSINLSHANVIGPSKDGIYKVDKFGSNVSCKKKKKKLNDIPLFFNSVLENPFNKI